MAKATGGDPVYGAALAKAVGLMERDEANGVPAADVAVVVRRVLESRRPPRRVLVARRASERGCWPSGCCRSAPSRPRRRAAWESDDRTGMRLGRSHSRWLSEFLVNAGIASPGTACLAEQKWTL